jgi:hypothetical protein
MTRRTATSIAVAVASLGLLASMPECTPRGSGNTPPVGPDARADQGGMSADQDFVDASPPRDPSCDAAAPRWPGWTPVTQLSSCCPAAMATDPTRVMPPFAWVPCKNGAASCQELTVAWSGAYGTGAKVSHDGAGNPKWLMFMHIIDGQAQTMFEQDLYDIATGEPLAAWRATETIPRKDCYFWALLGQSTVTLDGELSDGLYVANGDPRTMTTNPVFRRYASPVSGIQEELASDSIFAFDLEPQAVIARTDIGSGTLLQQKASVGLLLGAVEGSDAFAISEHGSSGYGQLYVLDSRGSLSLLRSNPSAHVATPASDGVRLYWTETYGSLDVRAPQARTELWSAPYTADPAVLARAGSKLAVIPNSTLPLKAIAFGGLMGVILRDGRVYVGRVADGKLVQANPGPGRRFGVLLAVTASELWSLESDLKGAPLSSLTRVGLGSW